MPADKVWLLIDLGPVSHPGSSASDGLGPVGICESETEGHAVVAWRYSVEGRLTELRAMPFVPHPGSGFREVPGETDAN